MEVAGAYKQNVVYITQTKQNYTKITSYQVMRSTKTEEKHASITKICKYNKIILPVSAIKKSCMIVILIK